MAAEPQPHVPAYAWDHCLDQLSRHTKAVFHRHDVNLQMYSTVRKNEINSTIRVELADEVRQHPVFMLFQTNAKRERVRLVFGMAYHVLHSTDIRVAVDAIHREPFSIRDCHTPAEVMQTLIKHIERPCVDILVRYGN